MKGLIVEDDEIIRLVIKNYLLKHGHSVLEAENGELGLRKFTENEGIQYILTDLMMPIMGGIEMARKIRATKNGEKLPIIGITAGKIPSFTNSEINPFDLTLEKPMRLEDLLNHIQNITKQKKFNKKV